MPIPTTLEAATNCWTKAEQFVYDFLIQSDDFRDIIEAGTGAGTLEENTTDRLYLEGVFEPDDNYVYVREELLQLRYFGVVTSSKDGPANMTQAQSQIGEWVGTIVTRFSRLVTNAELTHNRRDMPLRWFKNRVGNIATQLKDWNKLDGNNVVDLSGGAVINDVGILNILESSEVEEPEQGFWLTSHLEVAWGLEQ